LFWTALLTASLASLAISLPRISSMAGIGVSADRSFPTAMDGHFDDAASRGFDRAAPDSGQVLVPGLDPAAVGSAAPAATPPAPAPLVVKPIGGLTQAQMNNAVIIVRTGRQLGMPRRAVVVALATALQESRIRNLANRNVAQSLRLPNQGVGSDFDSVGIFQQRPSQGWGKVSDLMNPSVSAQKFYSRLAQVDNWPSLSVGDAAQAVQRSAYPGAYAQHQRLAERLVAAVP
jgi:hypothetical protein